jgi:hypothetical protein
MENIWIIIALLPILLITALYFGYEATFYFGVSLFGLSFWLLTEKNRLKLFGILTYVFGTIMYSSTIVYYLVTEQFFPPDPFEFKLSVFIIKTISGSKQIS